MSRLIELEPKSNCGNVPTCRDFDEDCDEVPDKVHCYLYDPAKGMCPYLRTISGGKK